MAIITLYTHLNWSVLLTPLGLLACAVAILLAIGFVIGVRNIMKTMDEPTWYDVMEYAGDGDGG